MRIEVRGHRQCRWLGFEEKSRSQLEKRIGDPIIQRALLQSSAVSLGMSLTAWCTIRSLVYTPEQQQRLGVDENGNPVHEQSQHKQDPYEETFEWHVSSGIALLSWQTDDMCTSTFLQ